MEEKTTPVNVARLRAEDRAEAVSAFVGEHVDLTAAWGSGADQRTTYRKAAAMAVATVFGEPMSVLVVVTDEGRVLAIKMSRLLTIARTPEAEAEAIPPAGARR